MSKKVAKALFQELVKHHKHATKLQSDVVRKTELARQTIDRRNGDTSPAVTAKAYENRPLDSNVVESFKLHELRENDSLEIVEYLKHQLQYKQLLEKYASGPEDTLERVHATARRVGLDASKL